VGLAKEELALEKEGTVAVRRISGDASPTSKPSSLDVKERKGGSKENEGGPRSRSLGVLN